MLSLKLILDAAGHPNRAASTVQDRSSLEPAIALPRRSARVRFSLNNPIKSIY
jgi:hypothetical protein